MIFDQASFVPCTLPIEREFAANAFSLPVLKVFLHGLRVATIDPEPVKATALSWLNSPAYLLYLSFCLEMRSKDWY